MGACTFTRSIGTLGSLPDGEQFDDCYKNHRVVRGMLTMSTSYATGGDTLPLASIGLKEVRAMLIDPRLGLNSSGMSIGVDPTVVSNPKVLAWDASNVEVANATNLSTRGAVPVWFFGI